MDGGSVVRELWVKGIQSAAHEVGDGNGGGMQSLYCPLLYTQFEESSKWLTPIIYKNLFPYIVQIVVYCVLTIIY